MRSTIIKYRFKRWYKLRIIINDYILIAKYIATYVQATYTSYVY